jgi:hypothetical protein
MVVYGGDPGRLHEYINKELGVIRLQHIVMGLMAKRKAAVESLEKILCIQVPYV